MARFLLQGALALLLVSCGSAQQVKKNNSNQPGTARSQNAEAEQVLENLRKRYFNYKSFRARFVIKGKVDGRQAYYSGVIKAYTKKKGKKEYETIDIILRDGFLQSELYLLRITGNKVVQKDYLNDKTYRSTLDQFRWVQIFGQVFPFKFFLPVLKGYPPTQVYRPGAKVGADKVVYKGDTYDMSVKLKGDLMQSLFFRNRLDKNITIIRFYGERKNKLKRYFPRQLLIQQNKSEDYLKLTFRSVRIK